MTELFKIFGPWAFGVFGMWLCPKYLVTDKLKQIMAKLELVDQHESRLGKIETAMEIHGCMGKNPSCVKGAH